MNSRPYLSVKVYQAGVLRWSDTAAVRPCQQCRKGYIAMVRVTLSLSLIDLPVWNVWLWHRQIWVWLSLGRLLGNRDIRSAPVLKYYPKPVVQWSKWLLLAVRSKDHMFESPPGHEPLIVSVCQSVSGMSLTLVRHCSRMLMPTMPRILHFHDACQTFSFFELYFTIRPRWSGRRGTRWTSTSSWWTSWNLSNFGFEQQNLT